MPLRYYKSQNGVQVYNPFTSSVSSYGLTTSLTKIGTVKLCDASTFNYFGPYDFFIAETRAIKSDNSGTASIIFKIGPNQSTADQTVGLLTTTLATSRFLPLLRTFRISGTQSYATGATNSSISDIGGIPNTTQLALNLDFTNLSNTYYLTVWGQLSVSTNTMSCTFINIKHIPGASQST